MAAGASGPLNAPWCEIGGLAPLVTRLRREGYRVDGRLLSLGLDLLLAAAARGEDVRNPARAAALLAPICCASPAEQAGFHSHFDACFGEAARKQEKEKEPEPFAERGRAIEFIEHASRYLLLFLAVFVGMTVLAHLVGPLFWPEPPMPVATAPDARPVQGFAFTLGAIVATGLLVSLLVFAAEWLRAQRMLRRRAVTGEVDTWRLPIADIGRRLFDTRPLRQLARSARQRRAAASARWDVAATVRATIRNGGWLTPVCARCALPSEYLVLIEHWGRDDHQARLAESLVEMRAGQGVFVAVYFFRLDPRLLFSAAGVTVSLAEIAGRFASHRLLIISDGRCLLDPFTLDALPWVGQLRCWADRVLWSPRPRAGWGRAERTLGQYLSVLPIGAVAISQGHPPGVGTGLFGAEPAPMPDVFRDRSSPWTRGVAPRPEVVEPGLAALRGWLGESGFRWLAACACYPRVSWPVTLHLGDALAGADGVGAAQLPTLLKLSQLSWMRLGSMPEWLRGRLQQALSGEAELRTQDALRRVLVQSALGETETFEEVSRYSRGFLKRLMPGLLRRLRRAGSVVGPAHDRLFVGRLRGRNMAVPLSMRALRLIGAAGDPSLEPEARAGARGASASLAILVAALFAVFGAALMPGAGGYAKTALLLAAVLLPGFALGSSAYHHSMTGRDRPAWGWAFYWLAFALMLSAGSATLATSQWVGTHWPPLRTIVPLAAISLGFTHLAYDLRRSTRRYRLLEEQRIRRCRALLLRFWSHPLWVMILPSVAVVALAWPGLGLTQLDQRILFYMLVVYASSAACLLMIGGLYAREPGFVRLGVLYQTPVLLVTAWLFVSEVLGLRGLLANDVFTLAMVATVVIGAPLAIGWREQTIGTSGRAG